MAMNQQGIAAYQQQSKPAAAGGLDELVRKHLGLVRKIALHLVSSVGHVATVDDLMQSGVVGLIEAAGRYDQSQTATFEQFARHRIHGAMIDMVRQGDWRPRRTREETQHLSKILTHLEKTLGRPPHDREVAEAMGFTLERYQKLLNSTHAARLLSLDEVQDAGEVVEDSEHSSEESIFEYCEQGDLADALKELPERTQQIFNLYYVQDMNMKEIAAVFEVSEARICQLHGQGLKKLKALLKDWGQ
ncbi:sigma-70 family RNA polymerase sigma factor [Parendozoicomonas haliclonae]|uniref:RNA polymerase sigma factor n=1 Tax=Parendozoicomonas haliclonae TaxID=1960125 RepID=A0A1X7AGZ5_9GAMM|nr:RNA polymerase sigma factor FliA [Parendozoicomonas haliclonae]SMA39819.1 RNA polymerase sigma factor FliA [Parendozoicomonas haliclonae]